MYNIEISPVPRLGVLPVNINSGRRILVLFLAVVVFALLAGRTMYVGQRDHTVRFTSFVDDAGIGAGNTSYISPCNNGEAVEDLNTATARCFPDTGLNGFQVTGIGFVVQEELSNTAQNCRVQLLTADSSTLTPDFVASSNILIGVNINNLGGAPGLVTGCPTGIINAIGESCYLALDTSDPETWVEPGGWVSLLLAQPGVTNMACTQLEGGQFWIDGYHP